MDFSKTKLHQRTRSAYDNLYKEYNKKKKSNEKPLNSGGDGGSGSGGLVDENDGDRVTARVSGDVYKDKSSRKLSEGLGGSNGGRNEVGAVSRRTRLALKKRGENLMKVQLIDESEDDEDDMQNHVNSGIEEVSEEQMIEETLRRGRSRKRGKKVSQNSSVDDLDEDCGRKSSRTNDSQQNSASVAAADDALSYPGDSCFGRNASNSENEPDTGLLNNATVSNGDCLKGKGSKDTKDSSLSSRGFALSPGLELGESDDDDDAGVTCLGDDSACLEEYDPSHSSRVESNEVKVSPVELDSVQADADGDADADADVDAGLKSYEQEEDDPQKPVSPEENNAVAEDKEVICLSSSDSEDGEKDDYKPHIFNPKPVYMPKSKTKKVDFFVPVVGEKHKRYDKSVERDSKKRRTDADSSLGFVRNNNKTDEDTCWQWEAVEEKGPSKADKVTSKTFDQFGGKVNAVEILKDAMMHEGDGDNVFKRYVDIFTEDIPEENTQVVQVQSYKFKFEDEEDPKPDKSECEIEMDELFDEMNMCLQLSEIGSDISMVNRDDADFLVDGADQATCCHHGKHELTINDEFGIICRYCPYVEMEIRDILPPLSKNGRGGHGRHDHDHENDKSDNMKFSDLKLADCNQDRHHDSKMNEYEKGTVWDLVPGVKESMYPHQRDGFEFIWQKIAGGIYIDKLEKRLPTGGSGCIISHAPGTGKSRLTIVFLQAFLKMYPSSRPLIVAPRSMLLTWEEEFKKWNTEFPFFNLNNTECSGQEYKKAATFLKKFGGIKSLSGSRCLKLYSWKKIPSILGVTYRLFESLAGEEGKRKRSSKNDEDDLVKDLLLKVPTLLVLDEGHTPRNDQSLMWKTLLNVKTKRSIILSGTPFQNNFDELYNTLCLVNPLLSFGGSSFNGVKATKKRGWKHNAAKGQWDSITSSVKKSQQKLQELRAMIDPFVHVHKGTILQERLPGLRDALVVLKPTRTQNSLMLKMGGSKATLKTDCLMSSISVHPSLLSKDSPICTEGFHKMLNNFKNDPKAGVKTEFLIELIKLCDAHNEKVLVFSQYIRPLVFIMELLNANFRWVEGRECLYMDGTQDEKLRQSSINTLNDPKGEAKVLLASLRACSEGINLVGASRVVLLDVHWNPSVERQAISRAYRLGQKKLVHVYHLVTGSMEGEKYIRQVEKSHLSELVFSSKNKDSSNKVSSAVIKDKILEEMVQHDKLQNMFEKVIYQPKEADLIDTFG
ncbi:SNF2 domain-containing protein CLASSY 4-like [Bidens hawaiensis]|uniref:SNF2 domain-containing protein CLASSY 4-like n=1 Tax=Bidens hawaiensis TaxID=980011 RepID=UPI00404B64A2